MPGVSLQIFSEACRDLYGPGLAPGNFSARSFSFLQRLVPAEFVACGVLDTGSKRLNIGFDTPHSGFAGAMEALGRLMTRYPLYNWDPSVNGGRPFRRSQFFSNRQFRDLDIYREVYRPLGIDNHCAFHVPARPGEIMFFGVERDGGPDFSDEELSALTLAQSQLANALALSRLHDSSDGERVCPSLLTQAGLTPREAETLSWINEGKSNHEIALLLRISLHTVKDHVASIFDKTGVGNRLAAIVWARCVCRRAHPDPLPRGDGFVEVPATPRHS